MLRVFVQLAFESYETPVDDSMKIGIVSLSYDLSSSRVDG
jgi:hypothetical protein